MISWPRWSSQARKPRPRGGLQEISETYQAELRERANISRR